jgi:hypothetical protein
MSGLVVSSIDKWFMGPIPQFSPEDLGVPGDKQDLQSAIKRAQAVASDPAQMAWQTVCTFHGSVKTKVLMRLGVEYNSERFIASGQKPRCTHSRICNALSEGIR